MSIQHIPLSRQTSLRKSNIYGNILFIRDRLEILAQPPLSSSLHFLGVLGVLRATIRHLIQRVKIDLFVQTMCNLKLALKNFMVKLDFIFRFCLFIGDIIELAHLNQASRCVLVGSCIAFLRLPDYIRLCSYPVPFQAEDTLVHGTARMFNETNRLLYKLVVTLRSSTWYTHFHLRASPLPCELHDAWRTKKNQIMLLPLNFTYLFRLSRHATIVNSAIMEQDRLLSTALPLASLRLNDANYANDRNNASDALPHSGHARRRRLSRPYKNIYAFLADCDGLSQPSEEHETCTICMHDFTRREFRLEDGTPKKSVTTGCGHVFHLACLMKLITSTSREGSNEYSKECPLCRTDWYPNPTPSIIARLNSGYKEENAVCVYFSL